MVLYNTIKKTDSFQADVIIVWMPRVRHVQIHTSSTYYSIPPVMLTDHCVPTSTCEVQNCTSNLTLISRDCISNRKRSFPKTPVHHLYNWKGYQGSCIENGCFVRSETDGTANLLCSFVFFSYWQESVEMEVLEVEKLLLQQQKKEEALLWSMILLHFPCSPYTHLPEGGKNQ